MYEVIKSVIDSGNYKLEAMLQRIHTFAAKGLLSADEMSTLEEVAREKATVRNDTDLFEKIFELEQRIRALEENKVETPVEEYPPYKPGKWYYIGDRVSENSMNYVCCAPEGVVCTWSPSEYPAYWDKV